MPARKPTRLLEISGAFKKDPQRRRNHEPIPSGPLGDPPGFLPEPVKACWRELNAMIPRACLRSAIAGRWNSPRVQCPTRETVQSRTPNVPC
jgi:hypothetical protein